MTTDVKIGLETHIQLDTETKLFCGCPAELAEEPNTRTCEVCLGMPGSKPRTNSRVVDFALQACQALNCDVNSEVRFSRKVYFYPDMSKNFQITQYEIPIGGEGTLKTRIRGEEKEIGIKRLHIEEDPARLVHKGGDISSSDYTLVDYNRAGMPLIEIVTKPDFTSPEEARAFLQKLTKIMEYLGIYDPSSDLSIKSDANVSIDGGSRVEVKNITGTKGIEKALNYEITRQKNLAKRGKEVERETRAYSSAQEITTALREKESEAGYGYIFEPDLTRLDVDSETVQQLAAKLPELPDQKFDRFKREYGLSDKLVESLITDPDLADDFEELAEEHDVELVASWLTDELKKTLNYNDLTYAESHVTKEFLSEIFEMLENGEISDRNAEKLLREQVAGTLEEEDSKDKTISVPTTRVEVTTPSPRVVAEEKDLLKAESSELEGFVEEVLDENPDAVEDYREGKEEALNFLVGQVMQRSRGKADPKETREELEERLEQ